MQHFHLATGGEASLGPALALIRKIAYRESSGNHPINLAEFIEALRYLKIAKQAREALSEKVGGLSQPVSQQELLAAEGLIDPGNRLNFDHETSAIIAEMSIVWGQFISVHEQSQQSFKRQQALYNSLKQAANSLPGQSASAADIAVMLTRQITAKESHRPATLLLHGGVDGGLNEMAATLADTLQQEADFDTLTIDLAQFRSEGESASLDGVKSFWAGSKPGLVTRQLYDHPRSVIIFKNVDQTLSAVQACLMPALESGFMVDNYGLDELDQRCKATGQANTTVDCRQAVFIFTASTGSEWANHKDAATLLASREAWKAAMVEAMAQATREYRGHTQERLHRPLLDHLAPHLVSLNALTWVERQAHTALELQAALKDFSNETGWQLEADARSRDYLASLHLLRHPTLLVSALHRRFIQQHLLDPLCHTLFEQPAPGKAKVMISATGIQAIQAWLDAHRENPTKALLQRQLTFSWVLDAQPDDNCLLFEFQDVNAVKAHRLADYQAAVALQARVPDVCWDDVAGHEAAKAFLERVALLLVDATINPANLPRGALLSGPPGTGKTMLAKAFAARCGLPFIAVAGTDLLSTHRIDELYHLARKEAPCVIFIDEADALGTRGTKSAQHDAALTKLLSEIQGFSSTAPIFHIIATNLPDELDPALLRPQRIDHHFHLGPLDMSDRQAVIQRELPMLDDASRSTLAKRSQGFSGAQLHQLCQQIRQQWRLVDAQLTQKQIDDIILTLRHGPLTHVQHAPLTQRRIACHEAGHAIVHHALFPDDPIELLSIESRGNHGQGGIMMCQTDHSRIETRQSVFGRMAVALAGRAAEIEAFGVDGLSVGSTSDLNLATKLAWHAISEAGLDEEIGPLSLSGLPNASAQLLDRLHERLRVWLSAAEARALELIRNHPAHDHLVQALIQHHRLQTDEILAILTKSGCQDGVQNSPEVKNHAY